MAEYKTLSANRNGDLNVTLLGRFLWQPLTEKKKNGIL